MVWAMSQDDKDGTNIKALTSAVGRKQMDQPNFNPNPTPMLNLPQPVKLCRWSGCYCDCPAGFKTMLRDGYGGEIMGSDENCSEGGFSKFCCPQDQEMPKCGWRGHRNSGNCSPGRESWEVEVGTLRVGCRSGHQTACCTDMGPTWAYGQCKWTGCGEECPGDKPRRVVAAWQGAGGEQSCSDLNQRRSYCCKDPMPADFTDCSWVQKGSPQRFESEYICEDSCPSDQVKITTEISGGFTGFTNGCFAGAKAYCKQPKPLEPRDETTYGGNQNAEFKLLLQDYMQNPTCPATIMTPTPDPGNTFISKRSLVVEAAHYAELHGRATDCNELHFRRMITFAALLLTRGGTDTSLAGLETVYNDLFANSYDTQLVMTALRAYYNTIPYFDPNSLMRYVFLNPLVAGPGIRREARTAQIFCQVPTRRRKRGPGDVGHPEPSSLSQRFVYFWPSDTPGIPDSTVIYRGIVNGQLSLHYARWQYINTRNFAEGPMLELAYWIGPTPGVSTLNDPSFDQYRDQVTTPSGATPDRWVVLHLHINAQAMQGWLRTINGRTHIGIQRITMFHGHQVNAVGDRGGGAWRVDGRDSNSRNERQGGFHCPDDSFWYPGAAVTIPNEDGSEYWTLFRNFGNMLFNSGYLSSTSLSLILNGPGQLANGDVDPNNVGALVNSWSTGFQINPWLVNFLIINQGNNYFNFAPDEPPP